MIDAQDVVYRAKINGYFIFFEKGFISVFDEDATINKNAQCLYRNKVDCSSKKDFEMEAIYASVKANELNGLVA